MGYNALTLVFIINIFLNNFTKDGLDFLDFLDFIDYQIVSIINPLKMGNRTI